jgi:hypothetical protein
MVTLTYDGSQDADGFLAYVDAAAGIAPPSGVLTTSWEAGQNFYLAKRSNSFFFEGNIDEVTVWNVGLSGSEVTELYGDSEPSDPRDHSQNANLESWFQMCDHPLDDPTGTTGNTQDRVGSNHGTPFNTDASNCVFDVPNNDSSSSSSIDWEIRTVDAIGTAGNYNSTAEVSGQSAVAYYDYSATSLKYARYNGATWDVVTVYNSGVVGLDCSLAVINGQPAISFYDATNNSLRYTRYNGATWGVPETVDNAGNVGLYTSLTEVSGQPAISYHDSDNTSLKYARYNGATWDVVTIDSTGVTGIHTSLAVISGQPAISYLDDTNNTLRYTRYNGATWDTPETVDSATVNNGSHISLAEVSGQPAISYLSLATLKYARYNGATWDLETVDNDGAVGFWCSMAVVNGQPAISYRDDTNQDVKYARYNGSNWDTEMVVSANVSYTSIAEVGGKPSISYGVALQGLRNAIN